MEEKRKKEDENKKCGQKIQTDTVRVEPILKQPPDMDKLCKAFLSLAIKLIDEESTVMTDKPENISGNGDDDHDKKL